MNRINSVSSVRPTRKDSRGSGADMNHQYVPSYTNELFSYSEFGGPLIASTAGGYFSNPEPTADAGGWFYNFDDFYNFMVGQAKNNPVEVAAFEVDKGTFFVQPWAGNTYNESFNDFSFVKNGALSQYHTHPGGSPTGYTDALRSQQWNIPVHAITPSGKIWRVHVPPLNRGGYIIPRPAQIGGTHLWIPYGNIIN